MAKINISVMESDPEAHLSILEVEGIIDTVTVEELEKVLDSLSGVERSVIIINLAAVEYISLAGWSALIARSEVLKRGGGYLCLAGLIPNVKENFREFEFDQILDAHENLASARQVVLKIETTV